MKVNTMASRLILSFLLSSILSVLCVTAQAQVYKWVDDKGNVTYSDAPPPKSAVKVEAKSFSSSDQSSVTLPFELAQAVKNMPITFYSSSNCAACDDARSFLKQNGIPFAEKTVTTSTDSDKLKTVSGGTQVPFLTMGRTKLTGFNSTVWRSSLTDSGYPQSNILPAAYQYPTPQPAAPVVAAPTVVKPVPVPNPTPQPADDPNGFRF